jgi:hypothetical protein
VSANALGDIAGRAAGNTNMAVGGYYLAVRVANTLVPMVRAYGDCVRDYFLPAFDDLNTKADEVAKRTYSELTGQPVGSEMDDPADAAEAAQSRGEEFYNTMFAMRQGTLNMFTAGLFHLLEQQLATLGEDATFQAMGLPVPEVKLGKTAEWYRRYLRLDLTSLADWPKINDELRGIANAVKHGEGSAARKLRQFRPDLFADPRLAELGLGHVARMSVVSRLSTPLAGDDLFVTSEVLEEYTRSAVALLHQIKDHFLLHRDEQYP